MAEPAHPVVDITIDLSASVPAATQGDQPALLGLDEPAIERVAALALAQAGITRDVELSVVITSDDELRRLNREYRGRDEATDVLSFPLLDAPLAKAPAGQLWGGDTLDQAESPILEAGGETAPFSFVAPPAGPLHLGDIVIAHGVTCRQAAQAGHAPAWELAYLVAHGVLHLVGYDDHTDAGYAAMVTHQETILRQAGISR